MDSPWVERIPKKMHLTADPLDPFSVCLLSQTWCRAQPPSRHQPTTSRPCPPSKPWPPTRTAAALTHWRDRWTRVSEHLDQLIYIQVNHHLLHYVIVISSLCASMLSSENRSIFLFALFLWSGWSFSRFCSDSSLQDKVSSPSVDSKVNPLLPCGSFWWSRLHVTVDSHAVIARLVCLGFNSFIFIADVKLLATGFYLSPHRGRQMLNTDHSCPLLSCTLH